MKWRYRYSVLAICSASFAMYHAARQVLPPALPLIKDELGLSYTQAGFVSSCYDIGYGLTLITCGYAAYTVSKVRLILIGLLLLSASLILTTFGSSYLSLSALRILTGASFGAYFAAGVSIISSYFPREERGKALGIHTGMGAGSGKLIAPLMAGLLLPSLGWSPLFYFVGIPVLLMALVFWRVVKEPEEENIPRPTLRTSVREIFCSRFLLVLGVANALITGGTVSLYSFMPLYLVKDIGTDLAYGGFAVAFLNGVSIPIVPTIGALSDRFGRKTVIFALSICGTMALYLFPLLAGGVQVLLGIVLLGVSVGTAFPVVISYVVDASPLAHRNLAVGYINTFSVLGGSAATILSGYVSDIMGVEKVFPFLAGLSALAALFVLLLREPRTVEVAERAGV